MIQMICHTLGQKFPGYAIYKEQTQRIEPPAFLVQTLESCQRKRMGNLYNRESKFVIGCHLPADAPNPHETFAQIADSLQKSLELMEYEGERLRGFDMKHRIEDNVLQFFVTCRENVRVEINEPVMENMKEEMRKKG